MNFAGEPPAPWASSTRGAADAAGGRYTVVGSARDDENGTPGASFVGRLGSTRSSWTTVTPAGAGTVVGAGWAAAGGAAGAVVVVSGAPW